jgi:hypothetical protein
MLHVYDAGKGFALNDASAMWQFHSAKIMSCTFSADGKKIASGALVRGIK